MIQSMYTAAVGARSLQYGIDTVANNISNINTGGFKSSRVSFKDAIYQTMRSPIQPQDMSNNLELGYGSLISDTSLDFSNGALQETGNVFDFAIVNDGFFAVQDKAGEVKYTRAGAFSVSTEQDGNYLVTSSGNYVLDENYNRIKLGDNVQKTTVDSTGQMFDQDNNAIAKIAVVVFDNQQGLEKIGDNLYEQTTASGEARQSDDIEVRQGCIESSNVDVADELTKLIQMQRAYSLLSSAITTADEMESTANNLRR